MRLHHTAAAAIALALALPSLAHAGTVTRSPSAITYQADQATTSAESIQLGIESNMAFVTSERGATTNDCTPTDPNRADCPLTPAFIVFLLGFDDSLGADQITDGTTVEAHGGGGHDDLSGGRNGDTLFGDDGPDLLEGKGGNDSLDGGAASDSLDDGPGDDVVTGGGGDDTLTSGSGRDTYTGGDGTDRASYGDRGAGVTITLDGQADDGEAGEGDNIASDVEEAVGGSGNDNIVGSATGALLRGGGGSDNIRGGVGGDRIEGEEGDDTIDARDGKYDSIDCGPGTDTVLADLDDGTENCEIAPDRDGDGFPNEADCAPDNAAINPSAGEVLGNDVDEDCKGGPNYLRVDAGAVFKYFKQKKPPAIRWKSLRVVALDAGDHVEVRCKGKGCPFKKLVRDAVAGRPAIDLTKAFKKRLLKKGVVVEIRITHEGQIGIVRVLTVAKGPKVKEVRRCLPPGSTTPGPCPAS